MTDPVERVAQAIDPIAWLAPHEEKTSFRRLRSREQAVAALLAIREATFAMADAGVRATAASTKATPRQRQLDAFAAMIDAAFSSPSGEG